MLTKNTSKSTEAAEPQKHIFNLPKQLRYLNAQGHMAHGLFPVRKKMPKANDTLVFLDVAPNKPHQVTCTASAIVEITERSIIECNPNRPEQIQIISGLNELHTFAVLHGFAQWPDLVEYIKHHHGLPANCLYVSWHRN